jgi:hypothetical protein
MTIQNPLTLKVKQIREISNYSHWIPITRGYHREFLEENFPGWDWNDLLPVLLDAGLVNTHIEEHDCTRLMMGLCLLPKSAAVELTLEKGISRVSGVKEKK